MKTMDSIAQTSILNSNNKKGHRKSDRKVHFDTSKNEVRFYTVGRDLSSSRFHRRNRKGRKMDKKQQHWPFRSDWDNHWSTSGDCKDRDNNTDVGRMSFAGVLSSTLCQAEEAGVYLVNGERLIKGSEVLKKILDDDQKQLEALNILQGVVEQLQHPKNVLRLFFDVLFDEGVVRKEVFHKWASAAALQGKDAALSSVGGFFTWLNKTEAADCI